jgi:DNA-binding MarR family transcriptional regulator
LAQREVAEEDRRQVFVSLTSRGEEVLDRLANQHREELRRIGNNLARSLEEIIKANDIVANPAFED